MAINAVRTILYGWNHHPDGSSTCRKWFMILWFPIIPLKRYHVISNNIAPSGFMAGIKLRIGLTGNLQIYEDNNIEIISEAIGSEDIIPTYLRIWGSFAIIIAILCFLFWILFYIKTINIISDVYLIWIFPILIGLLFGLPIGFALYWEQYSKGIRKKS